MGKTSYGQVLAVRGEVVDVEFAPDELPEIYDAIEIARDGKKLVLETQQHLGGNAVRCVAMESTDGLARGVQAINTGAPISVPVGPATLGRLFNVLGEPIDNKSPVQAATRYPIHRPAPAFDEQSTRAEVLETGIKV